MNGVVAVIYQLLKMNMKKNNKETSCNLARVKGAQSVQTIHLDRLTGRSLIS